MITQEQLQGNWNEVKGKIQQRWGQLSDDDLRHFQGGAEQLVGVIQQRTGEARERIENYLEEIATECSSTLDRAADTAREYSHQASEAMHRGYEQASQTVRTGYAQAGQMVRRNPVESIAVAFGAGLITGVVVGLALRSR